MGEGSRGGPRRFFKESPQPLLHSEPLVWLPSGPVQNRGWRGHPSGLKRRKMLWCGGHLGLSKAVFSEYFCLFWGAPNTKVQPPGSSGAHQVHRPLSQRPALVGGGDRRPWRPPSAWPSWLPCLPGGHGGPGSMPGPAAQRRPITSWARPGSN